jgi:hypothetical protein
VNDFFSLSSLFSWIPLYSISKINFSVCLIYSCVFSISISLMPTFTSSKPMYYGASPGRILPNKESSRLVPVLGNP